MSRTRIVGGKYTKLTKENHYMFSDDNISTSSLEPIHEEGIDDGILHGIAKEYEPWKSFPRRDWYHCVFGHTINKMVPITDLGLNTEVNMCLTGISSIIRFEGYDLDSKAEYKYHNWLFILTVYMNNRGELVEGGLDTITYKSNNLVGSTDREIEKQEGSKKIIFQKSRNELKSKGKELHDEIFLDGKLIFADGMERAVNFGSKTKEPFRLYDALGDFLKEASRFNRRADISYIYAGTSNAKDFLDTINDSADKISLAVDAPMLEFAFNNFAGATLFKEIFGVVSYATGTVSDVKDLAGLKTFRGPIQLSETLSVRNNSSDIMQDPEHYRVTNEFEILGETLLKTK